MAVGSILAPVAVLFWFGFGLATLIAGLMLAGLAGRQVRKTELVISQEPVPVLIVGLAGLLVVPVLAVLLMISVLGAPLGLGILFGAWPLVAYLGYLVAGIWIGDWVLARVRPGKVRERPYLASVVGLVLLQLVGLIPVVGLLSAIASLFGFGAVLLVGMAHPARPGTASGNGTGIPCPRGGDPRAQLAVAVVVREGARAPEPVKKEVAMHAIVVYESHWGCTKAVAEAIAEGIGTDARALTTDEATPEVVAEAGLVVAGAPVIAFALPRASATAQLAADTKAPRPADVSHPLLRAWLERIPAGRARFAAFETRIWWSPRRLHRDDRVATLEGRLREDRQGRAFHRRGRLRAASRGRAGIGLASGARRSSRRSARLERHQRPDVSGH